MTRKARNKAYRRLRGLHGSMPTEMESEEPRTTRTGY